MSTGKFAGEEKGRCERCWREFYVSQLIKQEGHLRCTVSCVDDLSNTRRAKIISDVLSSGQDGVSEKPEMFNDPGEIAFE